MKTFFRSPKLLQSWYLYTQSDEINKFQHILESFNYLRIAGANDKLNNVFYEFGCHSGRTFSTAINSATYLKMKNVFFYAFDSFEGLPNTDKSDGFFEKGTFFTTKSDFKKIIKTRTGYKLKDKFIYKGFYEDVLSDDLQQKLPKVGIVHIDVDLYSSTIKVLNFIKPLLQHGTVILFDDWYCFINGNEGGEGLATKEFLEKNPEINLIPWKNYSTFGKSFFVELLV
jgi:hypothetical protein